MGRAEIQFGLRGVRTPQSQSLASVVFGDWSICSCGYGTGLGERAIISWRAHRARSSVSWLMVSADEHNWAGVSQCLQF